MQRKIIGIRRVEERTSASTSQGYVASTSKEGDILVSEAIINSNGVKQ